jgi:hypothetical protein
MNTDFCVIGKTLVASELLKRGTKRLTYANGSGGGT